MATHSKFNDPNNQACGLVIAPIKTNFKGPGQQVLDDSVQDIIDEAISAYRPNILFKNFDIKGNGDTFLIYMMVWITHVLNKIQNAQDPKSAEQIVNEICKDPVPKPNDAGYFMRGLLKDPKSATELEKYQLYIKQSRQELAHRLIDIIYTDGKQSFESKFWFGLAKKNFMNLKYK
ncbi:ARP2/3 complex, 21kDa subunit (p21-Arc) [Pseudocohnilembus persalinus]|uniref:Actin-related protein 2/3 complex subunit 3 n=1 Tax=Pseudocohnilembus persalinus TaxID=266149 RepID=A0A0V0QVG2_PSEPJ|nr:ARP2/3 complex, 21kDa subunit (p21-Arc) [Pseudocohnilembus persalinus]|eukprot:KRX06319.1 ARP2/3 complex, 21kDa subunit (p21-Arc) [Pseudocohnilembus persalinus]